MTKQRKSLLFFFEKFLSDKTRKSIERIILLIALSSFFVHLALIFLVKFGFIPIASKSELLINPIAAIYTPFSFILIYEVYLLIYYLPKSYTTYIAKQYEIITLIVIRRLFKDLSAIELSSNWFKIKGDLQFTYDLIASLLLFFLIYLFQLQGNRKFDKRVEVKSNIEKFVEKKKMIAVILVPIFLLIALHTLFDWSLGIFELSDKLPSFKNINHLFFDQFFNILILVDVVVLLISFFYTDKFHKIIRNSGFIISTILIRLSFGVDGLMNTLLIVAAVLFGLIIITIHNRYEKDALPNDSI